MRLMPIVTAFLVIATLYLLVFERETLRAFAQAAPTEAQEDDAEIDDTIAPVRVSAATFTARTIDSAVVLRGQTEAIRQVEVRAETTGLIRSEPQRKGAFVEAGDILCELDPGTRTATLEEARGRLEEARARLPEARAQVPAAQAALAEARARTAETRSRVVEAEARLEEARINQNAAQRLAEQGFASETRVANAQAALESARAGVASAEATLESTEAGIASAEAGIESANAGIQSANAGIQSAEAAVAAAEKEIDRLTITAPFDGLLETDAAELGTLLQPGGLCATVIQLDPVRLVGFVPETDVDKIEIGAMAGARLPSGREVRGEVTFLSRSADEQTRTFRVDVEVPNPDLAIRDGQTAEILISAQGRAAQLVPQSALTLNDEGDIGVRVVEDSDSGTVAGFMPVTILRDTVNGIYVTGLPETVDIITVGQEFVTDGSPIEPVFKEANG